MTAPRFPAVAGPERDIMDALRRLHRTLCSLPHAYGPSSLRGLDEGGSLGCRSGRWHANVYARNSAAQVTVEARGDSRAEVLDTLGRQLVALQGVSE